ncbi:hypothetical protein NADFUDRAFT_48792 [Nadsonia fulvescens var. elongata DSM 6958]|uniref:Mating factor alpha precursor N-terminal domain-containing protein n=1 Tax=Nadsonia fulvescens var. elongata DSM 6958 TaxID=857566 RepID=A0A1E3PRU2_9ASCO|nr:hypothetical protein NADFUDRAFT_48792 [Nadsonia fulvescens var. elongata DSM 6958]
MKISNLVLLSFAISIGSVSAFPVPDSTPTEVLHTSSATPIDAVEPAASTSEEEFGIPEDYIKEIIVFGNDDYPVFVQNSTHHGIVILDSSVLDNEPDDKTVEKREADPEAWRRWVPRRGEPLYGRGLDKREAEPEAWRRWVPRRGEPLYGK